MDISSGTQDTYATRQQTSPLQNVIQIAPLMSGNHVMEGQEYHSNFDPPLSSDEDELNSSAMKHFSSKNQPQSQMSMVHGHQQNQFLSPAANFESASYKKNYDPFSQSISTSVKQAQNQEMRTLDPDENKMEELVLTPPPEFYDNVSWNH